MDEKKYVSRAGNKLAHAFDIFLLDVKDKICADFGCSTGGFTQVLLENGAKLVYSVDTAKNELHWNLRTNPKVIVLESTNAMFVTLPEKVDFISIDTAWTKQEKILENAKRNLKETGIIVSLVKPQYEVGPRLLRKGKVPEDVLAEFMVDFKQRIQQLTSYKTIEIIESPIKGDKAGNKEFLMLLK